MFTNTNTKQVSWKAIAAFLVLAVLVTVGAVVSFNLGLTDPIAVATRGLVGATLQANLVMLALVAGVFLFLLLRLKPSDVGLVPSGLPEAVTFTALIWVLLQIGQLLVGLVQTGTIAANPQWTEQGFTVMIGWLLGQLFGNALYEEIAYRGFLLRQVYSKLEALSKRRWLQLAVAMLASQSFFAVIHIPVRLYEGMSIGDALLSLVSVLLLGIFFAAIYIRTNNLFLAVGVHALINQPMSIFGTGGSPLVLLFALVVVILWPTLHSLYSQLITHNLPPAGHRRLSAQH